MINLIGATKRTGLRGRRCDTGTYQKGVKVEDDAIRSVVTEGKRCLTR